MGWRDCFISLQIDSSTNERNRLDPILNLAHRSRFCADNRYVTRSTSMITRKLISNSNKGYLSETGKVHDAINMYQHLRSNNSFGVSILPLVTLISQQVVNFPFIQKRWLVRSSHRYQYLQSIPLNHVPILITIFVYCKSLLLT